MRKYRHILYSIIALIMIIGGCNSNKDTVNNNQAHSSNWQAIDSLINLGQYATAKDQVEKIKATAAQEGNWHDEYKAWMITSNMAGYTGHEMPDIIEKLETRAATAPFPLTQLLHSIIGTSYWSYYQQERWQVLERTNTAGTPDDMRTWGQQKFIDAAILHLDASLSERDRLLAIPSSSIGELSTQGNFNLRPTLYDLLAFKALDVYRNSESRLAEPAWRFGLDSENLFDLYEEFAYRKVEHRDSSALLLKAVNLYKDLTRVHMKDDDETAFIGLNLDRLRFINQYSTHSNKDSLYLNALLNIRSRVPDHPGYADITHEVALWHSRQANKYQRLLNDDYKWERKAAVDICKDAIEKFPESVGAKSCHGLVFSLEMPEISLAAPSAVSPNEDFLFSLTHKNISTVHFRMYPMKVDVNEPTRLDQDALKKILNRAPESSWQTVLENDRDLQSHLVELPANGVNYGRYMLVAGNSKDFRVGSDVIAYTHLWSTDLSVVARSHSEQEIELQVLSRSTGTPLADATIEQFRGQRNGRRFAFELVRSSKSMGQNSTVLPRIGERWNQQLIKLTKGEDVFISPLGVYHNFGESDVRTVTHFFLNRAIYRPGQEIFFKGIVVRGSKNDQSVQANIQTTVELHDVNGQKIAADTLTTDEFGAFSGVFKAPGGLSGVMRIHSNTGSTNFRVEEYKRPKFEVLVDPIEGEPRLGEDVDITGSATSFAGVPVDGGTVQWKVTRQARMPWWCWGYWLRGIPWGTETEIANGVSQTDGSGVFQLDFPALPDVTIPKGASPLFHFQIEVSVTDINGETQTGKTSMVVAYQTLQIELNMDDVVWKDELNSLEIDVRNMNGQHVDSKVDILYHKT